MGAVTDMALSLARGVADDGRDERNMNIRAWRHGQISGMRRLALEMDFNSAWEARQQFDDLIDQLLKAREVAP